MKTLNLVYPDKSEIKYKISKFPDGQQNIIILESKKSLHSAEIGQGDITYFGTNGGPVYSEILSVQIKSRFKSWQDLEIIVCAKQALSNLGVKEVHLYVPYVLGGRSDRSFSEGEPSYLSQIVAPVLNSLNFESVTVVDPHSDVMEACIKNFKKISNINLVAWSLENLQKDNGGKWYDNFILVSPDAGASKKVYKLADQIGYKGDIITCSKDRDHDGELIKTVVPIGYNGKKDIIIIDDICDGGATFINIARAYNGNPCNKGKKYLIVTHGIFSKGLGELIQYFDGIYCTNSYKDFLPDTKPIMNQLNIF